MEKSNKSLEEVGFKIFKVAKNELYLSVRHIYLALDKLNLKADRQIELLGTDGKNLYFMPLMSSRLYLERPIMINRAYLHSVLHSLLWHLDYGDRDEYLWDLACDIVVESIIDNLQIKNLQIVIPPLKEDILNKIVQSVKVFSASNIYRYLVENKPDLAMIERFYKVDDHRYWKRREDEKNEEREETREGWDEISKKIQTELEVYARNIGTEKMRLYQSISDRNRKRVSYEDFLRKFRHPVEEITLDLDNFDYGLYSYGIRLYGNIPLIEELEYKNTEKIRNFIIAIDTSGSVSNEMISEFLSRTVEIFSEEKNDYSKSELCTIIQCDNQIQEVMEIRNREELLEYAKNFEIKGRGGTDFRAVFNFIEEEVKNKRMSNPKGLLYLTDGYGTYPKEEPSYETVFIFSERDLDENSPYYSNSFPKWAKKLAIDI